MDNVQYDYVNIWFHYDHLHLCHYVTINYKWFIFDSHVKLPYTVYTHVPQYIYEPYVLYT